MNTKAWFSFALATLGPVIGWAAHEIYAPAGRMNLMGFAVFISWTGFFFIRGLSGVDWKA